MNLTNESYIILIGTKTERYYRTKTGWVKESMQGRKCPRHRRTSPQPPLTRPRPDQAKHHC